MNGEIEFLDDVHTYLIDGVRWPSVTDIIQDILGDRWIKHVDPDALKRARQRGKRIHALCHYLDENDLDWDEIDDEDKPYVESYILFKDTTGFQPLENEKIVVNKELRYAGTLDKKGILYDRRAIVDLKSGECGKETGLQTAGYALADGDAICDRYGLRLIPGKMSKPIPFKDPRDFLWFRGFVTAYYGKREFA